jgi:hypothetical protein
VKSEIRIAFLPQKVNGVLFEICKNELKIAAKQLLRHLLRGR